MNQIFNKLIKLLIPIIMLVLLVVNVLIVSFVFFPDTTGTVLSKIGFFDLLFGDTNFRTSTEHQKTYGIETAKISNEEEKKLNSMVVDSIKAQLEYYSTAKDESLEKVKNLYIPEEFETYKKYVKLYAGFQEAKSGNYSYDKIEKIKLSPPRAYKILPDRVGIITFIKFNHKDSNSITQIFIFKNINSEWKIEKQIEVNIQLGETEAGLIEQILDSQKYK